MKKIVTRYYDMLIYTVMAAVIGVIVGAVDTVFGKGLLWITDFRSEHIYTLLPFLPIVGIIIVYVYTRYGKDAGKGMTLLFATKQDTSKKIPLRLIPLVMISTWLTHLFGGSAGREGVAVQIGGTVAYSIGNKIPYKQSKKIWLICGMAAGFAGLFQTPIAAVFFAMEVFIAGTLEYGALCAALVAAFTAYFTSHSLGLEKFAVDMQVQLTITPAFVGKIILIGLIFGLVGAAFALTLGIAKVFLATKLKSPVIRIFVMGSILAVVLICLYGGRYCGLGTNLISNAFSNKTIYSFDWIAKLILTVLTLAAGYQGGEVTPLFAIGSSLGVILGGLFGLPVVFVAALGYAAVFGSATNTLLAPMFIGGEVFGFEYMPYFCVVCAIAYIFNGNQTIYGAQIRPTLDEGE